MALQTMDKMIGGRLYRVAQLPAFQALDLLEQLTVLAGPALGALVKNGMKGQVDFESGAVRLFSSLGGGKLRALASGLLASTTVELSPGKSPRMLDVFDVEYAGRLSEVFQVLAFALEVQFADFFDAAKDLLGEFLAAQASASNSPSASSLAGSL